MLNLYLSNIDNFPWLSNVHTLVFVTMKSTLGMETSSLASVTEAANPE